MATAPRSVTYSFPSVIYPFVTETLQVTQPWYRLLVSFQRIGIGRQGVSLGASPAIFTATRNGIFITASGTIEFSRDYVLNPAGATWDLVSSNGGSMAILSRDSIRVTYSGATPGASFYADS